MLLFVVLLLFRHMLPAEASNSEGNALYAIKQGLNDSRGILGSWDRNLADPCSSWTFVTCDGRKHVIKVSLAGQGFGGVLSSDIGKLPWLQTLEVGDNSLTGSLPSELGNLTQLLSLNAENNSFTGFIPSSLGRLSKLKYLVLGHNELMGSIPMGVVEIPSLLSLDLSYNNLMGAVPDAALKIPQYNFVGNNLTCEASWNGKPCMLRNSPGAPTAAPESSMKRLNLWALVGGLCGGILLLMVAVVLLVRFSSCSHCQDQDVYVDVAAEEDVKISFGQLKRYSWRELQVATDNFHDMCVLGQGGFGKVFKGVLGDGTQVAVKRLKDNQDPGGEAAFLREVEMIGVAAHRNLLSLLGFCVTPSERLLVYPFMANRSVTYQLRERKEALDWRLRKDIALGAARGLAYLHHHCNPRIIHRDVKAANVLLDENFQAVVGDFGLAKLVDNQNTHVTTVVRGTMGHIAPEYLSTGKSSEKTDVFGYGIMLLELVTGQRAIDFSRLQEEDNVLLLDHVKKLLREKRLSSIVDPRLQQYVAQEVEELIQVALLCTQPTPEDRPTMLEVVRMLIGEGLAERWEEWQQIEGVRMREFEMMPQRLAEWAEDSTMNQEAVELSAGR